MDLLYKNLLKEWIIASLQKKGEAGEELAVDEAAVWKRILDYRVVQYMSWIAKYVGNDSHKRRLF